MKKNIVCFLGFFFILCLTSLVPVQAAKLDDKDLVHFYKPVMVFYYADWCKYCTQVRPIVEKIKKHPKYMGRIHFQDINVDQRKDFVKKYYPDGQGVPRFQFYDRNGNLINSFAGAPKDQASFESIISKNLGI